MAIYNKERMTRPEKPRPDPGWHTMKVRREMPSRNHSSQHCFILENEYSEIWFNCFLPDLPKFAAACGIEEDSLGNIDTKLFVGKFVDVEIEDREHRGKMYRNAVDFRETDPMGIPEEPGPAEPFDPSLDSDIPF